MRQVQTYYPVPFQHQRPAALAGLFSWLGRAVKAVARSVVTALPFTDGNIWSVVNDLLDGDGQFGGQDLGSITGINYTGFFNNLQQRQVASISDLPLTAQEEAILDNWVTNSFTPAFRTLLDQIKRHTETAQTLVSSIKLHNKIQEFIAVLRFYQQYSLTIIEPGLSENAKLSRNEFLNVQIAILEEQINTYIFTLGIDPTQTPFRKTIEEFAYRNLKWPLPAQFDVRYGILNINAIDIDPEVVTTTQPDNEIVTITDNDIIPDTTPIQSTSKQTKWILWLLAGAVAYRIIKK